MTSPKQQLEVHHWEPRSQPRPSETGTLRVRLRKRHSSNPSSQFQLETEFAVVPGVTVIVGHSGAGKTTILRCIGGLCDPEEGRIAIGDRLLFDSRQRINVESARRQVGFVFQDLALFPHLSVEDNVTYGLRRLDGGERMRRMSEVLEAFQIEHLCRRFPREISGGEQQRVALARSLVTEPLVLLLDEPLSSLDPRTKDSIIEDLRSWNEARRIPILYVTHDYEEVLALADRVIALDQGQIVAEGLPQEIITALRREQMAQPASFENLFDATVFELREQEHTMICQIAGTSIQIETPLAPVPVGSEVRIGIRADEILIAASPPAIVGACSVIQGRVKQLERIGATVDARISCGGEFRVRLASRAVESSGLKVSTEVWMMIRAKSCHLVRPSLASTLQRLFVFVCSGNTSRSPMAQAICNAEIANRLGVPLESLDRFGIKAISAGLSARPGEPLTAEAEHALATMGMPGVEHRSGNLTHGLAQKAEVIFCMTEEQRQKLIAMFPEAASKVHCLQPFGDIDDPSGKGSTAFLELASLLHRLIGDRLNTLGIMNAA
ncbi:MAG: ATP-binding cassette domain-containing protein [Pyrinomonadaceae bacterium]|nr:ATP-binding cassette domain-containing protein [Pyrinomonadaceae bacterium]